MGLASLLLSLALLAPPDETGPSEPAETETELETDRGELEPIYALMSLRLGVGPAFHPQRVPDKGLGVEARLGAVFVIPPIFAIWPELGGSFEARAGFERALGSVDLNLGLPAFLYYGVGFEAGVEGRARLLGLRHGLDLRFFQVFGIQVLHHVTHTPVRDLQHEIHVMFSFDVLSIVLLSGSKATMWQVGERHVGR